MKKIIYLILLSTLSLSLTSIPLIGHASENETIQVFGKLDESSKETTKETTDESKDMPKKQTILKSGYLPQTGEKELSLLAKLGIILIATCGYVYYKKK